jgi:hypothetical protein
MIGAQCSGTLILSTLGLLNGLPVGTELITKPRVIDAGIDVLNQPIVENETVATAADACHRKKSGRQAAESAIHYVAPVGEKEETVDRCLAVVEPFIDL